MGLEALPLCTAGDSALSAAISVLYAGSGAAAVLPAAADTGERAGPEEGSEGLSGAASDPAAVLGGLAMPACNHLIDRSVGTAGHAEGYIWHW